MRLLPGHPGEPGLLSQQVHLGNTPSTSKARSAVTDDQHVAGLLHNKFGETSDVLDVVHRADSAAAPRRPVHHARVKLYDALFIGEAAEADA